MLTVLLVAGIVVLGLVNVFLGARVLYLQAEADWLRCLCRYQAAELGRVPEELAAHLDLRE